MHQLVASDASYFQLTAEGIVLVVFHVSWHIEGLCRNEPALVRATEQRRIPLIMVNIDQCPLTARRLKIISVPETWLLRDGQCLASHLGTFPYSTSGNPAENLERSVTQIGNWIDAHFDRTIAKQ